MLLNSAEQKAPWYGALELAPGSAIWQGSIGDGAIHRHFAAQAVLAQEPVGVIDALGDRHSARCILIDPFAPHRLEPTEHAVSIYVEPVRRGPAAALEALLAPARRSDSVVILAAPGTPPFWSAWLNNPASVRLRLDPKLEEILAQIDASLPDDTLTVAAAASQCGLSEDRFRHYFAEEVGISYRRYQTWRRIVAAVISLQSGCNVTSAAHQAGFADAAHFARTLKSTFGITASQTLIAKHPEI